MVIEWQPASNWSHLVLSGSISPAVFALTNLYTKTKVLQNKYKMETRLKNRVLRSEKMTKEEKKSFDKMVESFDTKRDAAIFFGFSTITLDALLLKGSGKPGTISLVRDKLKQAS